MGYRYRSLAATAFAKAKGEEPRAVAGASSEDFASEEEGELDWGEDEVEEEAPARAREH